MMVYLKYSSALFSILAEFGVFDIAIVTLGHEMYLVKRN